MGSLVRRLKLHEGGYGDSGSDDEYDGDDGHYDDRYKGAAAGRSNRRWDPLEEQRLLAWRREKKSWKWIFNQFPDRSEGAIRVRWHTKSRPDLRKETCVDT